MVAILRTLGFMVVIYLDDPLILIQCMSVILEQYRFIRSLLQVLGFVINEEKSVGTPSQVMEFLELIVDTVTLSFRLPSKKVDSMIKKSVRLCSQILQITQSDFEQEECSAACVSKPFRRLYLGVVGSSICAFSLQ